MSESYCDYISFAKSALQKKKLKFDQNEVSKDLVGFNPEAKRYWIDLYNEVGES